MFFYSFYFLGFRSLFITLIFVFFVSSCTLKDEVIEDKIANMNSEELINYSKNNKLDETSVNKILDKFNTCSIDEDCETFYGECPFGCHQAVNKKYVDISKTIMSNWKSYSGEKCVYDCVGISGVSCIENKCKAIPEKLNSNDLYMSDIYESKGVGPDISFEAGISTGTLVIKKVFEDHSDHLFIDENLWTSLANSGELILPGNKIEFKGHVEGIDAGAGNHYYKVIGIENLKKVGNPNKEEVENIITNYGLCEKDSDCISFYGECPLGCYISVNLKYEDISKKLIKNFIGSQENKCVYKCKEMGTTKCDNFKCTSVSK